MGTHIPVTESDYAAFVTELEQVASHYDLPLVDESADMFHCAQLTSKTGSLASGGRFWSKALRSAENRARRVAEEAGYNLHELMGYMT